MNDPSPADRKAQHAFRDLTPPAAPSIPESWNLITAGDGAIWQSRSGFGSDRRWRPVDLAAPAIWLTDVEILELGPVREARIITVGFNGELGSYVEILELGPVREARIITVGFEGELGSYVESEELR